MDSGFGLAQIKPEGYLFIPIEAREDDVPLPFLPKCARGAVIDNKMYSRKEYTFIYILEQPFV